MQYNVIGLMSGSSLDGLDIAYVRFEETAGAWAFEIGNPPVFPTRRLCEGKAFLPSPGSLQKIICCCILPMVIIWEHV